jgi:dephospho-CoA kinase
MGAQLTDDQRAPLCDLLLANDGDQAELVARVESLWTDRLLPFERNTRTGRRAPRGGPELVDHQSRWAADGRRLAARVSHAAGGARVDHIGSTAIQGLPAKDVIDLQLTVPDLATADELRPRLTAAGFPRSYGREQDTPHPEGPSLDTGDPDRWLKRFHANADPGRSLNLHVRVMDSPGWRWALIFRDWLIAEPSVAAEYLAVKRSAIATHGADPTIDGYALAKEPWLAEVYPRGLAWAAATGWSAGPG